MTQEEFIESSAKPSAEGGQETTPPTEVEAKPNDDNPKPEENAGTNDGNQDSFTGTEKAAYDVGWRPEEGYTGKNPWKDAQTFLTISKLNQKISELHDNDKKRGQEFDRRLEQQKKVHDSQIEAQKKDLEKRFNSAVEEGDVDAANKHRTDMEDLNKIGDELKAPQPTVQADPEVEAWITRNPWINTDETKGNIAKTIIIDIETNYPHISTKEQFEMLDKKMGSLYAKEPNVNPKRMEPTMNETTVPTGRGRTTNKDADMSTLRDDEKDAWRLLGKSIYGGDEKAFLKSVNKNRKELK